MNISEDRIRMIIREELNLFKNKKRERSLRLKFFWKIQIDEGVSFTSYRCVTKWIYFSITYKNSFYKQYCLFQKHGPVTKY